MHGGAGLLKKFVYQTDRVFVVAAPKDGGCSLQKYVCDDEGWQLSAESVLSASGLADEEPEPSFSLDLRETAEQTAMEIARKGWQEIPLLFVVPENEQLSYALNLPPGLTESQQQEAAYWEMDDKLLAQGLSVENFTCVYHTEDGGEGRCTITGVRQGYLQEIEEAFAQEELQLADIIPASGGMVYLNSRQREMAGFKRRPGAGLAVRRILAGWFVFWLVMGMIVLCVDFFHYQLASDLAAKQQSELAGLASEQQEMQTLVAEAGAIDDREKKIQALNRPGISWYSLLVHLGANTTQGVSLTGINVRNDGQQLYLEGQAVDYDCLAEFIEQCEADKAFFTHGVMLQESTMVKGRNGEPDTVKFSAAVNWESENDGKIAEENQGRQ